MIMIGICFDIMILLVLGIIFNIYYITSNIATSVAICTKEFEEEVNKIKEQKLQKENDEKEVALKERILNLAEEIKLEEKKD